MVKIYLSPRQKEMLNLAKEQGYILLSQTFNFYADDKSRRAAVERLVGYGLLKDVGNQKFKFVKDAQ